MSSKVLSRCALTDGKVTILPNLSAALYPFHSFSPFSISLTMPSPPVHQHFRSPKFLHISRPSSSSSESEILGTLSGHHQPGPSLLTQGFDHVSWETYEAAVEKVVDLIGGSEISDDWANSVLHPFRAEWDRQDERVRAILFGRTRDIVKFLEAVPEERRSRRLLQKSFYHSATVSTLSFFNLEFTPRAQAELS